MKTPDINHAALKKTAAVAKAAIKQAEPTQASKDKEAKAKADKAGTATDASKGSRRAEAKQQQPKYDNWKAAAVAYLLPQVAPDFWLIRTTTADLESLEEQRLQGKHPDARVVEYLLVKDMAGFTAADYLAQLAEAPADKLDEAVPDIAQKLKYFLERDANKPLAVIRNWSEPPPQTDWLIKDWLEAGTIGLLTGKGGSGKTTLAWQLAYNLATGTSEWLGSSKEAQELRLLPAQETPEPQKVIFVSWENTASSLTRMLPARLKKNKDKQFLLNENLIGIEAGPAIWEPPAERHISVKGGLNEFGSWLDEMADKNEAKLVVLDPLAAAYVGNENDRSLVRRFIADRARKAQDIGFTLLIVAHPAKAASGESSDYSGSTDWRNGARAVWTLQAADIPLDSERVSAFKADREIKANLPPVLVPVGMRLRRDKTNEGQPQVPDLWLMMDEGREWKPALKGGRADMAAREIAGKWYMQNFAKEDGRGSEAVLWLIKGSNLAQPTPPDKAEGDGSTTGAATSTAAADSGSAKKQAATSGSAAAKQKPEKKPEDLIKEAEMKQMKAQEAAARAKEEEAKEEKAAAKKAMAEAQQKELLAEAEAAKKAANQDLDEDKDVDTDEDK